MTPNHAKNVPPPQYAINHRPVRLFELAEFQAGLQISSYQIKPDGPIAIIRKRDIVKGHLNYDLEHANIRNFPENHALKAGDVVLHSHYGTLTPIVIDEPRKTIACASPLVLIRIRDKAALLPEYLAWYLRTSAAHQTLEAYEGQKKPAFATIEGLYAISLALPSPKVQRLISGIHQLYREQQRQAATTGQRQNHQEAMTLEAVLLKLARP